MKYVEKGDDGYSHSVGYQYNKLNNLTQQVETINGVDHTTSYTYDDDNRVETVTTGGVTVTYFYDDLGRVSKQETKNGDTLILTEEFTYTAPEDGKTSSQIATYTTTANGYNVTYTYTYDCNGNITKIKESITGEELTYSLNTFYTYDSANQLIKERYPLAGYTYEWVYDNAGNILSRTENGTTTVSYGYDEDNTGWGDLLTSYNGQAIESDPLGNITDDGTWEYTWEHGRQLASMSDGTTAWNYTYNADGLRTKKTNGTDTYTYIYNGSQLTQMTKGADTLYFTYDASGTPLTLTHNGTTYYYVTNIQGDVVGILNSEGESIVTYRYEASGKSLGVTGTEKDGLGALNPLRYRGYVYDTETGLYYLQSRYYNPELGRFISVDDPAYLGVSGLKSYNLFAYCGNNPVMGYDPTGHWDWGVFADIVATVAAAATAVSIGIKTGISKFARTRSIRKAVSSGLSAAAMTFGAVNNAVNAVYYNCISDGKSNIETDSEKSSYVDGYVSRWERLDYTKQETEESVYNFDAWSFHSEYSLHMYGWYATSWAYEQDTPLFSGWANNFQKANITPHAMDPRGYVAVATAVWGLLGI